MRNGPRLLEWGWGGFHVMARCDEFASDRFRVAQFRIGCPTFHVGPNTGEILQVLTVFQNIAGRFDAPAHAAHRFDWLVGQ